MYSSIPPPTACYQKAEPTGTRIFARRGQNQFVLQVAQALKQAIEIMTTPLDERRQFFQLSATDSRLHVRNLEIVAKMRINVFVVVTLRKFSALAVKAVSAKIILARRTHAIASPVAERANQLMQFRIVGVNCAALPHSQMMRGIKTRSADVADCPREFFLPVDCVA